LTLEYVSRWNRYGMSRLPAPFQLVLDITLSNDLHCLSRYHEINY